MISSQRLRHGLVLRFVAVDQAPEIVGVRDRDIALAGRGRAQLVGVAPGGFTREVGHQAARPGFGLVHAA